MAEGAGVITLAPAGPELRRVGLPRERVGGEAGQGGRVRRGLHLPQPRPTGAGGTLAVP